MVFFKFWAARKIRNYGINEIFQEGKKASGTFVVKFDQVFDLIFYEINIFKRINSPEEPVRPPPKAPGGSPAPGNKAPG